MTHFYLKLIIPIAVVCLTFMLTARAIGTTQPPNPALRGFIEGCENKPQPCWYGIVPGVTMATDAINNLKHYGYSSKTALTPLAYSEFQIQQTENQNCTGSFTFNNKTDLILVFTVHICSKLYLGDVLIQKPTNAFDCFMLEFASNEQIQATIIFTDSYPVEQSNQTTRDWKFLDTLKFSLHAPIQNIRAGIPYGNYVLARTWEGIRPRWRTILVPNSSVLNAFCNNAQK